MPGGGGTPRASRPDSACSASTIGTPSSTADQKWQRAMASRGRPVQSTPPSSFKSPRSGSAGSDKHEEEATPGDSRVEREKWEEQDMVPRAEVERMRRDFEEISRRQEEEALRVIKEAAEDAADKAAAADSLGPAIREAEEVARERDALRDEVARLTDRCEELEDCLAATQRKEEKDAEQKEEDDDNDDDGDDAESMEELEEEVLELREEAARLRLESDRYREERDQAQARTGSACAPTSRVFRRRDTRWCASTPPSWRKSRK
ncbi:hypothetical protein T484DRAFT_2592167 [Baffinella frigidus]|nr:hypothetical protein T484DRAFT_2592167 [Cryptophyta sp. CCMP2293]